MDVFTLLPQYHHVCTGWDHHPCHLERSRLLHDLNIADQLYSKLLNHTPNGYRIISDTAFPRCTNRLNYRILTPMKKGDRLPDSPRAYARLKILNEQLVSAWQAAEWGMRLLQGFFGRLKLPLPATNAHYRAEFIKLVASGKMPIGSDQSDANHLPVCWKWLGHSESLFSFRVILINSTSVPNQ